MREKINNDYFEWLFDLVCGKRYPKQFSFRKLLSRLHETEFTYLIPMDRNRAEDGKSLRRRFILKTDHEDEYDLIIDALDGPCSILEMMIALSIRCEEDIMDDARFDDRAGQWFWGMIANLGLGSMTDNRFDKEFVDDTVERLLYRDYEPDGKGGLFRIRNCGHDLRKVEIWHQLCWYLDTIMLD